MIFSFREGLNLCLKIDMRKMRSTNSSSSTDRTPKSKWSRIIASTAKRLQVARKIPAADKSSTKPSGYPCGICTYRKTRFFDYPVGLYGSAPGVVFSTGDNTKFSVGMNCPDTALGRTNSIRLLVGHDAKGVAERADGNDYAPETARTNGHTCTGRRAADLGSVNYAILSVQQGGVEIADDNNFGNRCPEQKMI
ncbi:LOW QUALITY PROTEIN: hypothetical protein QC761_302585 [Podospora bellae-mahoneyi]|uniref:Uncharacterized protein n=1 Tax=Podospora bellae-mahoneyi TaxID=2093777 RepID=A0ABR0FM64_9PEZI|nr:LOW QUALITY PROTEIN: hypothetical protein QC761_302585 [Podospora bellae-mahoneyi]